MQVLSKFETQQCKGIERTSWTNGTYFSAAVFQQDVDVLLVFKMVIKVHNVFMVENSVQLNLSVNLPGRETQNDHSWN